MTRGSINRVRPLHHRYLLSVALAVLATVLTAGCAEEGSAELVSADAPVFLEPSESNVAFENRAGLPLVDIRISIVPYGPAEFTRVLPRIENTARREVPLNEFRSRDGTAFNLRVTRPKAVKVTARDLTGKEYAFEVPWN